MLEGDGIKKLHQLNMLGRASAKNLFSLKMLGWYKKAPLT